MTSTASADAAGKTGGDDDPVLKVAQRIKDQGESPARSARDPVNQPMIHNWVEAIGDSNPVYVSGEQAEVSVHGGLVAPPAMAQVWTMGGLHPDRNTDDPLYSMMAALDEAGYASVVATNCEQTYHRYLRHGEHVSVSTKLEEVVGPKRTGLGPGWFVTTRNIWYVGDEPVAEMLFRVLKFRPEGADSEQEKPTQQPLEAATANGQPILPAMNSDTEYFWHGTQAAELRIQRCGQCGLLRHPPGPMCPECHATSRSYLVACGRGEVYSYVVHHRPAVPGKDLPLVIALVELDEGVRMLGEMEGIDPEEVHIGLTVEIGFRRVDERVTLPFWRPAQEGNAA